MKTIFIVTGIQMFCVTLTNCSICCRNTTCVLRNIALESLIWWIMRLLLRLILSCHLRTQSLWGVWTSPLEFSMQNDVFRPSRFGFWWYDCDKSVSHGQNNPKCLHRLLVMGQTQTRPGLNDFGSTRWSSSRLLSQPSLEVELMH